MEDRTTKYRLAGLWRGWYGYSLGRFARVRRRMKYEVRRGRTVRRQAPVAMVAVLMASLVLAMTSTVAQASIQLRASSSGSTSNYAFLRGSNSTNNGSGATTALTLTSPAATQQNDLMVVALAIQDTNSTTPPTGWQLTDQFREVGASDVGQTIYWKLAGSGESSTTFTFNFTCFNCKASATMLVYGNVNTTSPINVSLGQAYSSSTSVNTPSVTTTVPNTIVAAFFATGTGTTYSSGCSNMITQNASTGGNASTRTTSIACDRFVAAAGSTGITAATVAAAGQSVGHTVAIAPKADSQIMLNAPAGLAQNDVLVAAITVTGNTTIIPPSGWQTVQRTVTTGNEISTETWYKVAGSSEPANYIWSWTGSKTIAGIIAAYTGVDTASPIGASAGQASNTNPTITAPSITTTTYGSRLVAVFGNDKSTLVNALSPLIERDTATIGVDGSSVNAAVVHLADQQLEAAGSTGTRQANTEFGGISTGQLIALNPAIPTLSQGSYRWFEQPSSLGADWTIRNSAADIAWRSVTYGDGKFVAVSNEGENRVMTSPDGVTWTLRTNPTTNDWNSVAYGNGLFVAVATTGTGNRVMTSPDGITWTSRTSAADNFWQSVVYGNGLFVAVAVTGTGNRVMTSPDGITWTSRTSAADNAWWGLTYGNGLFVAVGQGAGNGVMTSPDGITWTSRTSIPTNNWQEVVYGNGLYAAVANDGTGNRVMTSPDGITWTSRTTTADNAWRSIAFGNDLFVATAYTGTGNRVMTSPDGITWTARTAAVNNNWKDIVYGGGLFVAVAETGTGTRVMTSDAGDIKAPSSTNPVLEPAADRWSSRSSAADNNWLSITYGNGLFVAVASSGTGNRVMTSPDGITWTSRASAANNFWQSVTYGNGLFVAVASSGTGNRVMTSPDGITWTSRTSAADNFWRSVTYGGGLFVAVSTTLGTANQVMTSPDGIIWATRTSSLDSPWSGVAYGKGVFVAVACGAANGTGICNATAGNRVMTSPDGITWTTQTSSSTASWDSITYGNSTFVAVAGSAVMNSSNGMTWTTRTPAADIGWSEVTYGNGLFVAVASSGTGNRVMTSPDGITWTSRASAADNQWYGVAYGNGLFVAVSNSGTGTRIMTAPIVNATVGQSLAAQDAALTATKSDNVRLRMNVGVASHPYRANDIVQKNLNLQYAIRTGSVCSGSEAFMNIGEAGWTTRTSAADNSWNSVAYGNGLFVAVASSGTGNRVMTSPDGITWTSRVAADNSKSWQAVTYGNGLFVAISSDGTGNRVMTSPDGITWTSRVAADNSKSWQAVTYGNGLFVAVASSGTGNRVMTSPDGITWTSRATPANNYWNSITYGNGVFVAVSGADELNPLMTSTDGIVWSLRTGSIGNGLNGVAYGNGLFVVVASGGTNRVMTSPDGITWTSRVAADNSKSWHAVTYGNGLFVAVATSGTGDLVMTSPDGITWASRASAADNSWSAVTYGDDRFVAVSLSGTGDRVMTMLPPVNWGGRKTIGGYAGFATANSADPTQGDLTLRKHYYVTNNYFSSAFETAVGEYAMFDFDLDISNTANESSYCFRLAYQDGALLSSYASYPEITRCTSPALDKRMRHGTAFCGGGKKNFWQRAKS